VADATATTDALVIARDLDKIYGTGDAATHALRDVTFELHRGEFLAIIGQSGSGKSTLLNMIGLLDTPTSGTVLYEGRDGEKLSKKASSTICSRSSASTKT